MLSNAVFLIDIVMFLMIVLWVVREDEAGLSVGVKREDTSIFSTRKENDEEPEIREQSYRDIK